jgi:hypothetical protein
MLLKSALWYFAKMHNETAISNRSERMPGLTFLDSNLKMPLLPLLLLSEAEHRRQEILRHSEQPETSHLEMPEQLRL